MPRYLYALYESDSGIERYVGVTVSPHTRLNGHRAHCAARLVKTWVDALLARGADVQLRVIRELAPREDAKAAEHAEIRARTGLLNHHGRGAEVPGARRLQNWMRTTRADAEEVEHMLTVMPAASDVIAAQESSPSFQVLSPEQWIANSLPTSAELSIPLLASGAH